MGKQLSARCLESISLEASIAEKNGAEVQQKLQRRCSTGSCLQLDVGEAKSKKAKTELWGPPTFKGGAAKKDATKDMYWKQVDEAQGESWPFGRAIWRNGKWH